MLEPLQARLASLLRVPPEPEPPFGDPDSVRTFRAAPGFLRYRLLGWGLKQLGALVGLAFGIALLAAVDAGIEQVEQAPELLRQWSGLAMLQVAELFAIGFFLLQIVPSLVMVLLDYRYRWYMVTDRSLRIREGLWKVEERTMTFSNIQNVAVRQGPLQRLFGIADLKVRTAGGGGKSEGDGHDQSSTDKLHVGVFRGVANAAEIREAVLARLRRLRTAGLGDPDERPAEAEAPVPGPGAAAGPLAAARALLDETRALAAVLRGS